MRNKADLSSGKKGKMLLTLTQKLKGSGDWVAQIALGNEAALSEALAPILLGSNCVTEHEFSLQA